MFIDNNFGDIKSWWHRVRQGPRITLTLPVKRVFSFWPFNVIPRRAKGAVRTSMIEHEKTHWARQSPFVKSGYGFTWLPRYFVDKNFRWREEKRAIEVGVRSLQKNHYPIDYESMINDYVSEYHKMASYEVIRNFIYNLRDTNPYI